METDYRVLICLRTELRLEVTRLTWTRLESHVKQSVLVCVITFAVRCNVQPGLRSCDPSPRLGFNGCQKSMYILVSSRSDVSEPTRSDNLAILGPSFSLIIIVIVIAIAIIIIPGRCG